MAQIDITHARTLTDMSAFLQYLVSIYGAELYKDKQRLYNLIADLYTGEERQKKLFRRAILEDNMSQRVYELKKKKIGERKAWADAIAYRFAENNYFSNEIGQNVMLALVEGMGLNLEIILRQWGNKWVDEQWNTYSKDQLIFEKAGLRASEYFIKEGTKVIEKSAFEKCASLFSLVLPNSVESIREWAFMGCKSLSSVVLPSCLTTIERCAFRDCISLSSIVLPNNVTSIGPAAFNGCTSLSSIELPNSITFLGRSAFENCTFLSSVVLSNNLKIISECIFKSCASLSSIVIPNSVRSIENSAFC